MPDLNYYEGNMTVEWVNGIKYMSPSPHPNHGRVYSKIFNTIFSYLEGKRCEVFPDKTDLSLSDPKSPINIVDIKQPIVPDLFVVCDKKYELVGNNIVAIPDFICEIVSPSSIKMDNVIKKELYLSKGVREYWIVNYYDRTITVCFDGKENIFSFQDEVRVSIFGDLAVCLKDIRLFDEN